MKAEIIFGAIVFCSGECLAESSYLRAIKATAKFPDTVTVSDVVKYRDGTICGRWNAKNSYGLYGENTEFIFRNERLISEGIADNPSCSNLRNKDELHPIWSRMVEARQRQETLANELTKVEKDIDLYCVRVNMAGLCSSSKEKKEKVQVELKAAASIAEEESSLFAQKLLATKANTH